MKNTRILAIGLLLGVLQGMAQPPSAKLLSLAYQADSCYMAGDYAAASALYGEALMCQGAGSNNFYNAACCAAKAGQTDEAFKRLGTMLERFPEWYSRRIDADADLQSLHSDPRWETIAGENKARYTRAVAAYEHPLYDQLMAIWDEDQSIRHRYVTAYYANAPETNSLNREMLRTDTLHMQFVDSLYTARGWLGKKEIGDATSAVWLVVQHYGMDMWKKYLPVFREAAAKGDLLPHQVEMLEKRIEEYSK